MADKKIVNIFDKKNKSDFEGFEYVKLNRDSNGMKFTEEQLLEYAKSCHYIVRVMRTVNKEVCLYNFNVPSDRLSEFIKSFDNNKLKGEIIEVERFIPKGTA